jgi:3D (Asp-Asp-Asp) domain-containing protein
MPLVCNAEWQEMECTAYCDEGYTASGEWVHEGIVASDDLPMGTQVIINGVTYVVADRFGGGYSNRLDIFMSDYDSCMNFGRQTINVYICR